MWLATVDRFAVAFADIGRWVLLKKGMLTIPDRSGCQACFCLRVEQAGTRLESTLPSFALSPSVFIPVLVFLQDPVNGTVSPIASVSVLSRWNLKRYV